MIPTIAIIGADKGGVGKTMIARVLLDYLADRQLPVRPFDCQAPAGDLRRFCPSAEVIDISRVQQQMKVFDGAEAGTITVLDLPAGLLSPTLQALDDAKLLEDVRQNRMRLVLLHVLGPTMSSIAEIAALAGRIGGGAAQHYVVKNHINQTQFFEWDSQEAQAQWRRMDNVSIQVPQLAEIACETLQKCGGSFVRFTEETGQSRVLRGLVGTWLSTVWAEFDRVGLNQMVG